MWLWWGLSFCRHGVLFKSLQIIEILRLAVDLQASSRDFTGWTLICTVFFYVSIILVVYLNRNWRGTGVQIYFDGLVHPCEKVIGMFFFQNQIWSRLLDINGLCLVCIKRSIQEVNKCQISKHGYHQGPSDETLKKHDVNFAMSSSVTALWRQWVSLTIKCTVLSKLLLISQTSEARELFDDLRRWFA